MIVDLYCAEACWGSRLSIPILTYDITLNKDEAIYVKEIKQEMDLNLNKQLGTTTIY